MGGQLRNGGTGGVTPVGRRTAQVRYYVDADLLGLAKILVTIRSDVTYPSDPGGVIRSARTFRHTGWLRPERFVALLDGTHNPGRWVSELPSRQRC